MALVPTELMANPGPTCCQLCVHCLDILSMSVYISGEWWEWQFIPGRLVVRSKWDKAYKRHINLEIISILVLAYNLIIILKINWNCGRGEAVGQFQSLSVVTSTESGCGPSSTVVETRPGSCHSMRVQHPGQTENVAKILWKATRENVSSCTQKPPGPGDKWCAW